MLNWQSDVLWLYKRLFQLFMRGPFMRFPTESPTIPHLPRLSKSRQHIATSNFTQILRKNGLIRILYLKLKNIISTIVQFQYAFSLFPNFVTSVNSFSDIVFLQDFCIYQSFYEMKEQLRWRKLHFDRRMQLYGLRQFNTAYEGNSGDQ